MPDAGHYLWRGPAERRLSSSWAQSAPALTPLVLDLGGPCAEPPPPLLRLTPAFTLVLGEQPLGHHA